MHFINKDFNNQPLESQIIFLLVKVYFQPTEKQVLTDWIQKAAIDWSKVYDLAKAHQVRPLLLKSIGLIDKTLVPRDFRAALERDCKRLAMQSLQNTSALIQILQLFKQHDITIVPYKGADFAIHYYGTYGARETSDIDFFIYQKEIPTIIDVLKKQQYQPEYPLNDEQLALYLHLNNDYNFSFCKNNHLKICLEPHFKSNIPHAGSWFTLADLIEHTVPAMFENTPCLRFTDHAQVLLLLTHHGVKTGWAKWKYLADFYALLTHPKTQLDWDWLLKTCEQHDIQLNLLVGLALLKDLWQLPLPEIVETALHSPIVQTLKQDRFKKLFQKEVSSSYFDEWAFNVKARKSWWMKLKIIFSIVFKPSAGDIVAMQLPTWLYWSYYFIRPFRLLQLYHQRKFSK